MVAMCYGGRLVTRTLSIRHYSVEFPLYITILLFFLKGDEIVGINGVPIKGKSYEDSMNMLRNAPGKKIKVGVVKNSHNIKGEKKTMF